LRALMTQVMVVVQPEKHTGRAGEPRLTDVFRFGPTRRAVGGDLTRLAGAPYRHGDGDAHRDQAAYTGDGTADVEHLRRIGTEEKPPVEQSPGVINRRFEKLEPRQTQTRLIAQRSSRPLRRAPHPGDHDTEHNGNLSEQYVGTEHDGAPPFACSTLELAAWGGASVPFRCRSKTVIGTTVAQNAPMKAWASGNETPQA